MNFPKGPLLNASAFGLPLICLFFPWFGEVPNLWRLPPESMLIPGWRTLLLPIPFSLAGFLCLAAGLYRTGRRKKGGPSLAIGSAAFLLFDEGVCFCFFCRMENLAAAAYYPTGYFFTAVLLTVFLLAGATAAAGDAARRRTNPGPRA